MNNCPTCEGSMFEKRQDSYTFNIGGEIDVTVSDVAFLECDHCGEQVMDSECIKDIELKTLSILRGMQALSPRLAGYKEKLERDYANLHA